MKGPGGPFRRTTVTAALALICVVVSGCDPRGGGDDLPVRIAILPFENRGDTSDAYLADGIAEAVRSKLTRLTDVQVIARASSEAFRGSARTQPEIARELDVKYLVTGTVQRSDGAAGGGRLRVEPELLEVRDTAAAHRWDRRFERPLTELFEVQGEIATQLLKQLHVRLADSLARGMSERLTREPAAYQDFLRGEAITAIDPASLQQRLDWYQRAVARDTTFGQAWGRLALTAMTIEAMSPGAHPDSMRTLWHMALDRAKRHAPLSAETIIAELSAPAGKTSAAEIEALGREAVSRYPNAASIRRSVGSAQVRAGQLDDALVNYRLARQLDPLSVQTGRRLAQILFVAGDPAEYREVALRTLALSPGDLGSILSAVQAQLIVGDLEGARRIVREAPATLNRTVLYHYLAVYDDLYWILTPAQQDTVLAAPLGTLDHDRGNWSLMKAQIYYQRKQEREARAWADATLKVYGKPRPTDDAQTEVLRSLALAIAGRRDEAAAGLERVFTSLEANRENAMVQEYVRFVAVRTQLILGARDAALSTLEQWPRRSGYIAPGRLRIDPEFEPLRNEPRFGKLHR